MEFLVRILDIPEFFLDLLSGQGKFALTVWRENTKCINLALVLPIDGWFGVSSESLEKRKDGKIL